MTDFHFRLSKTKNIPLGTVVFKLTNKGKIPHNFRINGKTSKLIAPGKSGTLQVVFKKKGAFGYLCTVAGHAKLGMQGKLGVATSVTPPPPPTTTTVPPPTTTTTAGGQCTSNASTTVSVNMIEFAFQLSQQSVQCGTVTFQIKNSGSADHDFVVNGVSNAATLLVPPGGSTTLVVTFTKSGTYSYICDVPGHDRLGMLGNLTVTP